MTEKELLANIAPFGLRMQPDLKERIKAAAEANGRSMNGEIIDRLDWSFTRAVEERAELLELVHSQDSEIRRLREKLKGPDKEIERLTERLVEATAALKTLTGVAEDYRKMYDQSAQMIDGYGKMIDDSQKTFRILKAHVMEQYSSVLKLCEMILALDTEPTDELIDLVKQTRKTMLSSIASFSEDDGGDSEDNK